MRRQRKHNFNLRKIDIGILNSFANLFGEILMTFSSGTEIVVCRKYVCLYQLTLVCHCAVMSETNYRLPTIARNIKKSHTVAQICTRNILLRATAA